MACAKCELLEEQLADARRRLGALDDHASVSALQAWLKLSVTEARIAMRLHRAKSRFVPVFVIEDDLPGGEPTTNAVKVHMCKMRKKLGEPSIEASYGMGYRLTPTAHLKITEALAAGA